MRIPTHGPNCKEKFAYPTECRCCKKKVFLYGCTCGSSILFVIPFSKNERHFCDIVSSEINNLKKKKKKNEEIEKIIYEFFEWTKETIPNEYKDLIERHLGQLSFDF